MNTRPLLLQVALCLAGFVAINAAIEWQLAGTAAAHTVRALRGATDVDDLYLGNSLVAAAIVPEFVEASPGGGRVLNAALSETHPTEHLILLRALGDRAPARLHYGFFNAQLHEQPAGDWTTLSGNRLVAFSDIKTAVRHYAPDDTVAAWQLRGAAWLPVVKGRFALWVHVEKLRRTLGEFGLPPADANAFGRDADFAIFEEIDTAAFEAQLDAITAERRAFAAPIAEMLALAEAGGTSVTLIAMPMPSSHRARCYASGAWARYINHVGELARQHGAMFVDASAWMDDADFADPVHLSPEGGRAFTRRYADWAANATPQRAAATARRRMTSVPTAS